MNPTLVLIYGALIFLATVVASIPFGFAQGYTKARGKPLSERTLAILKCPEYATEALAVILVLAHLSSKPPNELLLHAVSAVLFASLITFLVEVRTKLMQVKEFWLRILVGLVVCVPVGILIGSFANAGT